MTAYTGTDNLEVMAAARNYNEFLLTLIARGNPDRHRMLDFGAGVGTFARALNTRGLAVDCVEPDPAQAAITRSLGLTTFSSIQEIRDESYAFIYSLNVLEHIPDDVEVLRQLARVLSPGGRLLIYVPAFPILYSSMDRKVGHVRRYRLRELADKVAQAGLRIDHARHADSLGFLASIAFKHLGNDSGAIDHRSVVVYDRWLFPLSRALDRAADRWVGKNIILVARKDPQSERGRA